MKKKALKGEIDWLRFLIDKLNRRIGRLEGEPAQCPCNIPNADELNQAKADTSLIRFRCATPIIDDLGSNEGHE